MGWYEERFAHYSERLENAGGVVRPGMSLNELIRVVIGLGGSGGTDLGGGTPGGGGGGEGGVTDHGLLSGKDDDDHPHYLTAVRGDARYYLQATVDTKLSSKSESDHTHGVDGGVSDHGALTGLNDDDHTQYLNNTRGDIRYYTRTQSDGLLNAKSNTGHTHLTSALSDATAVGQDIIKAVDGPAVRTLIGAGTSSLVLGTANTSAARGDHTHTGGEVFAHAATHSEGSSDPISVSQSQVVGLGDILETKQDNILRFTTQTEVDAYTGDSIFFFRPPQ